MSKSIIERTPADTNIAWRSDKNGGTIQIAATISSLDEAKALIEVVRSLCDATYPAAPATDVGEKA